MNENKNNTVNTMFAVGAHFGLHRSRRHPSVASKVFTTKNLTDIIDLEQTAKLLDNAKTFVNTLGKEGKIILFVGGKKESSQHVNSIAKELNMPFVDSRWIGGTLTNFPQIRKRIDRYERLISDREKGELAKYTKKERMLIDKEISQLEKMFLGIVTLKRMPDAMVVVDPKHEKNAMREAKQMKIPVIAIANSDCDIKDITYPILANDASRQSIKYFLDEIASALKAK